MTTAATRPDRNTHAVYAQTDKGNLHQLTAAMPYGSAVQAHAAVLAKLPEDHQGVALPATWVQAPDLLGRHRVVGLAVRNLDDVSRTHHGSVMRDAILLAYTAETFGDEAPEVAKADEDGVEVIWNGGYRILQAAIRVPFVNVSAR